MSSAMVLLATAAAGVQLPMDGVRNFRRVSHSLPGLYRSGALESATERDVARILDSARIRTVLDLRSDDEIKQARCSATRAGARLLDAYNRGEPVGPGCLASEGSGRLRRVHVPLLGDVEVRGRFIHGMLSSARQSTPERAWTDFVHRREPAPRARRTSHAQAFFEEVEARMPAGRKAKAMILRGFSGKAYDQMLYDELTHGGHELLYTAMLQSAPEAFRTSLSVAADRSSGSVLIQCAKGKDRTGLIAALLQHAAGDDEAQIADAYSISEVQLGADDGPSGSAAAGVDWSKLRGSPREAVVGTLGWLRREYGAIDRYLQHVGCGEDWRRVLLESARGNLYL